MDFRFRIKLEQLALMVFQNIRNWFMLKYFQITIVKIWNKIYLKNDIKGSFVSKIFNFTLKYRSIWMFFFLPCTQFWRYWLSELLFKSLFIQKTISDWALNIFFSAVIDLFNACHVSLKDKMIWTHFSHILDKFSWFIYFSHYVCIFYKCLLVSFIIVKIWEIMIQRIILVDLWGI